MLCVEVTKLQKVPTIPDSAQVKVVEMGNVIETTFMSRKNTKQTIKRLKGGKEYVICSTGEIKEAHPSIIRTDNKKSLYRTFSNIRGLINTNITNVENVRFCTLTYKENMTDTKKLYKDFNDFNKRFQYYCKKNDFGKPEYIIVFEPQKRGAWHAHLLYIWKDRTAPFIPNKDFAEIWGHGFVQIKQLQNIDNVGAYLTAYLTDLEFGDGCFDLNAKSVLKGQYRASEGEENRNKAYIKGARLKYYPAGFQIMRHSRGIEYPKVTMMTKAEVEKKVLGVTKTFERAYKLTDGDFESVVVKKQYNLVRKL